MPLKKSLKLIGIAQEEETREYAFRIYLAAYPNMDKDKFLTFNEFWEEIKPDTSKYDARSKDEIMKDLIEIENKFGKED